MAKIKEFFSLNKKSSLVYLFLLTAGLFSLPRFAHAQVWDWLGGILMYLPQLAIKIFLQILIYISAYGARFGSWLLNLVKSDDFISFSYTSGANNPIIEVGLGITQSFVNMGIVLALIFIAFAMILRVKGYETTKVFATLIIVALLVNFAPVYCGIFVDAGNITTNYFTTKITGMINLTNDASEWADLFGLSLTDASLLGQIAEIVQMIILIVFNVVIQFVLLMFILIFALRYVAIWMLVIFSPLAFVAYILPLTRSYFFQWQKQLIQWSFIGAIAGFFLYLAEKSYEAISKYDFDNMETGGVAGELDATFIEETFMYFVPLAFLIIGLIMSFRTSASGANIVVSPFQSGGKAAYQGAVKKGKDIAQKALRRNVPKGVKDRLGKESQAAPWGSNWGRGEKGVKGTVKRVAGSLVKTATSPFWATRRAIGEAGLKMGEADEADISKAAEAAKKSSPQRNLSSIREGDKNARIGALLGAIEEGQGDDLEKLGMEDLEKRKILREALLNSPGSFKKLIVGNSHLVNDVKEETTNDIGEKRANKLFEKMKINVTKEDEEKGITTAEQKILANIKPKDVSNLSEKSIEKNENLGTILKFWRGSHLAKAEEKFGRKFLDRFQKIVNGLEFQEPEWLENNNPSLDKYLRSSGARNLGIGIPTKEERKDNQEEYQNDYNQNKTVINNIIKGKSSTDKKDQGPDERENVFKEKKDSYEEGGENNKKEEDKGQQQKKGGSYEEGGGGNEEKEDQQQKKGGSYEEGGGGQ